jgi:hypothetical protein
MTALLRFACQQCAKPLRAPNGLVGKSVKCPRCSSAVVVHSIETTAGTALPSRSSAVAANSKLMSVLDGLIGPIPYGLAALAHWELPNGPHRSVIKSLFGFLVREQSKVHRVGCIAVKCQFLHLLDFGCKTADGQIDECQLFDHVRKGIAPKIISKPISTLTVKKASSFSSKVAVLSGALQLHVHPGVGDDFPTSLWAALCKSITPVVPATRVLRGIANNAFAHVSG